MTRLREESASALRNKEVRETAIPSHSTPDKGCSPCTVHQSAAEGYLLLQGLSDTYREEGQIPPGTSGTIHRARSLLLKADADAATVGAKDPRLRAEALALQGLIASLTPQLAREVKAEETPALAQQGHKAWIATGGRHGRLTLDPAEDRLGASGSG